MNLGNADEITLLTSMRKSGLNTEFAGKTFVY